MTILGADELREHIETDLGDVALLRLAASAEEMIVREAGTAATTDVTETHNEWGFPTGRHRTLYTARPVTSFTSIKERSHPDDAQTTLSADDYRLEGVRQIIRLWDGTNPRALWAPHVELIYKPESDDDIRKLVQIDLVKFAVMYSGAAKEKQGDFDFWHHETGKETNAILGRLRTARNNPPVI